MSGQGADELRIARILRSRGVGPDAKPQPDAVTAAAAAAQSHADAAHPQPTASAADEDWWDALYADDNASHVPDAQPDAGAAGEASKRGPMRIPPWWSGRHVDTTPPAAAADEPAAEDDTEPHPEEPEDSEDAEDGVDDAQPDAPGPAAPRRPTAPRRGRLRPRSRSRSRVGYPSPTAPRALVDTPAAPRRSLLDAAASVEPRIRWLILHGCAAAAGYAIGWVNYSTRTAAWIAQNGWLNASTVFWCLIALGCEALHHRTRQTRLPIRWACAIPITSIITGTLLYGTGWTHLDLGVSP